jgi:hypothetical protein
MATTPNLGLTKPAVDSTGWGADVNTNFDTLDTNLPKSNFSASAAPTVNDDSNSGYAVGSRWFDTTNLKAYICLDASAGTAVWKETTAQGDVTSVFGRSGVVVAAPSDYDASQVDNDSDVDGDFVSDALDTLDSDKCGAAANLTDNALIRGDGESKEIQTSGVIVDDSDNVSGINNLLAEGKIGVDTTNPLIPLQLNNYGGFDGDGNQIHISNNAYYDTVDTRIERIKSGYATQMSLVNLDGSIRFKTATTGAADSEVTFNERMRVTEGGDVGIGTATPSYDLHVKTSNDVSSMVETPSSGVGANAGYRLKSADGGEWNMQTGNAVSGGLGFKNITAGTTPMLIDSSGNIICSADADKTLTFGRGKIGYFGSADQWGIGHYDNFNANDYALKQTGSGATYINCKSGVSINFMVNNSSKMRIDSIGNLGIGTTTPNQKLTIEGSMSIKEKADANTDTAGYGQLWVKNTTPCELWFTDDAGNDTQIA